MLIRLTDKLNVAIAYRICVVEERAGMLILSYGMEGSFIYVYFSYDIATTFWVVPVFYIIADPRSIR